MENKRPIRLLLIANSISGVSQGISMLAIPWYFTGVIHDSNLFQSIYLVTAIISLFWGLYAGTLVDRYSRKNLFLWMNVVGFFVLSTATVAGFFGGNYSWIWPMLVFATTVFIYNIHFPTLYGFAQEITAAKDYARVTSKLEIQGQFTWTIAGALGAVLLNGIEGKMNLLGWEVAVPFQFHAVPIHWIFGFDALTYLVSFILIFRIKTIAVVDRNIDTADLLTRLKTGMNYLRKRPAIFVFGNASLFLFLCIIVQSTLVNPIYVSEFLHRGGDVYAMSDMVFSFGALLAGFWTTKVLGEHRTIRSIILLNGIAATLFMVLIWNQNLFLFFFCMFIIGMCNAAVRIQRVTYMFKTIPNDIIGRTGSVFFMLNVLFRLGLTVLFSIPLFGKGEGVALTNAVLGVTCLAGALLIFVTRKELRLIKNDE